jgi:hypothetical protein
VIKKVNGYVETDKDDIDDNDIFVIKRADNIKKIEKKP